ncbi:hypothetical protein J1N35_010266 [Gossypium stocksii]|uniref:RNase H type-1 domain-containing protein n=1 Tax=Gossypium stocksii TaxID=47602 RepID=A0A9D4AC50_9ROSI|nr:hypothetical protein J1N35_010266 [Gossypium stocksii]
MDKTKINVDGSVSVSQSRVATGGVIRGPQRGWLVGFGMMASLVDIFQVEAKVMLEGLKLACEWGFQQVEVEIDNALLLEILHFGFSCVNNIVEVKLLHTWIAKDWQVKLRLLSRDGNRVTNYLAKEILGSLNQLIILDEPSIYVRHLLEIDVYHAMSDVIVLVNLF